MWTTVIFAIEEKTFTKLLSLPPFLLPWFPSTWTPEILFYFSKGKIFVVLILTVIGIFSIFSGSKNTCVVQSAKSNHGQSQNFSLRSKMMLRVNCELLLEKKITVISWHIIVLSLLFFSHCRIPNLMQNSVFYHSKPSQHWGIVMDTRKCKEKEYWLYILPNLRFKFTDPKSQQQYSWQECLCLQGKRAKKDTWAPKQRFSHFSVHHNHLEALLKQRLLHHISRVSDSLGLGWSLRLCSSNKLPGDVNVVGQQTTLELARFLMPP